MHTGPLITGLILLLAAPTPEAGELRGQVVELKQALVPFALQVDPQALAGQVVVTTEDGVVVPLLADEASRALFADDRLRNRPARLQVRRFPGLPYVQVTSFEVEDEGRFRTPEYYCDICTISVRFPQACPCCQGDMELRMKPEAP